MHTTPNTDLTGQLIDQILRSARKLKPQSKADILLKVEKIRGQQIKNRILGNKLAMLDTQLSALVDFINVEFNGICRITDLPGIPEKVFAHGIRQEKFKLIPKNGETIVLLSQNLIEAL